MSEADSVWRPPRLPKQSKPVSVSLRQELWLSNIRFREIFIGDTDSKVGVFFKNHCLV